MNSDEHRLSGDDYLKKVAKFTPIIFILLAVVSFIYDWLRYDIRIKVDAISLGAELVFGHLENLLRIVFWAFTIIWAIVHLIMNFKVMKWKSFIPLIIAVITALYYLYIPFTNVYLDINYKLNAKSRKETIQMVENNKISEHQIGVETYLVPNRLLLVQVQYMCKQKMV